MASVTTRSRTKLILWLIAGLTAIGVGSWIAFFRIATVRSYATPAWADMLYIQTRLESPGSDIMLLKNSSGPPLSPMAVNAGVLPPVYSSVYRYNSVTEKLDLVEKEEEWDRATGTVCECTNKIDRDTSPLFIDSAQHVLKFRSQVVPTAGPYVHFMDRAPEGDLVAVLSSERPRALPGLTLFGTRRTTGTHYHEVFRTSDAQRIGKPMRLPNRAYITCWSSDRKYVIYTVGSTSEICFVRVEDQGDESR